MYGRRRSFVGRVFRWVVWLAVAVVVVPIVMAAAYRYVPPPATPLMVLRVFQGEDLRREWVPLERVSPNLVAAVIALEDTAFCTHSGIDWAEMNEAVTEHMEGGRARGASTITMQTAKNIYLWPGHAVARKLVEIPLAMLLETLWGKRRIMEIYLNIAEWGPGLHGAETAARVNFGKSARDLTPREAGLMAAVLPNPRAWSPARPTSYLLERMSTAVARSGDVGLACVRRGP
jgi:monofunctional biosynthetic peptidoglycan transglycosylase